MRLPDAPGQCFRTLYDLRGALLGGATGGSDVHCLEGNSARNAVRFAGPQRQQQMTSLKVSAADQVHRPQPGSYRPADINLQQIGFRDLTRIAFIKLEAAQTNQQSTKQQRKKSAPRAG